MVRFREVVRLIGSKPPTSTAASQHQGIACQSKFEGKRSQVAAPAAFKMNAFGTRSAKTQGKSSPRALVGAPHCAYRLVVWRTLRFFLPNHVSFSNRLSRYPIRTRHTKMGRVGLNTMRFFSFQRIRWTAPQQKMPRSCRPLQLERLE